MKLNVIKNVTDFFEAVDSCEGNVYLTTKDGDKLNLKSELTKYVAVANIFSNNKVLNNLNVEIICDNPADISILTNYLITE